MDDETGPIQGAELFVAELVGLGGLSELHDRH
jgi:hypothetical protein